jgi:hypothetical protein
MEMPDLQVYSQAHSGQGVIVIAIEAGNPGKYVTLLLEK